MKKSEAIKTAKEQAKKSFHAFHIVQNIATGSYQIVSSDRTDMVDRNVKEGQIRYIITAWPSGILEMKDCGSFR